MLKLPSTVTDCQGKDPGNEVENFQISRVVTENTISSVSIGDKHFLSSFVIRSVFVSRLNLRWLLSTFIRVAILRFVISRAKSPCAVFFKISGK